VPLEPMLQNAALKPAFDNVIPALCGALGVVLIAKNWRLAIAPGLLMLVLFFFVPVSMLGIMIPVAALFAMAVGRILYKSGKL
jgi:hypothetical protein